MCLLLCTWNEGDITCCAAHLLCGFYIALLSRASSLHSFFSLELSLELLLFCQAVGYAFRISSRLTKICRCPQLGRWLGPTQLQECRVHAESVARTIYRERQVQNMSSEVDGLSWRIDRSATARDCLFETRRKRHSLPTQHPSRSAEANMISCAIARIQLWRNTCSLTNFRARGDSPARAPDWRHASFSMP